MDDEQNIYNSTFKQNWYFDRISTNAFDHSLWILSANAETLNKMSCNIDNRTCPNTINLKRFPHEHSLRKMTIPFEV